MNLTRSNVFSAMLVAAAAMVGCGGAVNPGPDSGQDVTPTSDTGPDVVHVDAGGPVPCPTVPPTNGSACSQSNQQCSYGDDPSALCRRIATCNAGTHQWDVQDPEGCMVDAGNPTCPATTPASLSSCTANTQLCGYGDGTRCTCSDCPPGGPACMIGPLEWYCSPPPASCPAQMPNLGTACTSPGASCDYGACIGNGWSVACTDGAWVRQQVACAE